MPAFFIVSGYFCLLTIKRYGPQKFFNVRIKRIVIPLVTTAITLNTIQILILNYTGWKNIDFETYVLTGGWISHLWFLVNLIVYFSIAFLCAKYFSQQFSKINKLITRIFQKTPFYLIIFGLPLIWLAIKTIR